jgi:hypothetical protein
MSPLKSRRGVNLKIPGLKIREFNRKSGLLDRVPEEKVDSSPHRRGSKENNFTEQVLMV